MNEVQTGRFARLLRSLLNIKGESVFPSVSPEILATVDIETTPPETEIFKGVFLCAQRRAQPGFAALESAIQLFNPDGSGTLAVVTSAFATTEKATHLHLRIGSTRLAVPVKGLRLDTRSYPIAATPPANAVCETLRDNVLPAGHGVFQGRCDLFRNVQLLQNGDVIILKPGMGCTVHGEGDVDYDLDVAWSWYERGFERSEELLPD